MQPSLRLTLGVLANWQLYDGTTAHRYLHSLLAGARAAAVERGDMLLLSCGVGAAVRPYIHTPAWPAPTANSFFVPVGPWNCDGLVIVPPITDVSREVYVQELQAAGYPLVFAGVGGQRPAVVLDNASGMAQVVSHLYAHGHRQIAFIAGYPTGHDDSTERRHAFLAALSAHSLPHDPRLLAFGWHNAVGGSEAMQKLLQSGAPFTAVVASNDESAFGALAALRQAGLRVPEDIALTGFDDVLDARIQNPPLTTVHVAPFELGYRAVLLLDDLLREKVSRAEQRLVATRLVVRRSCGGSLATPAQSTPGELASIVEQVSEAALIETQRSQIETIYELSALLVHGLFAAFQQRDLALFGATVTSLLRRTEALNEEVVIWQTAVTTLRRAVLASPLAHEPGRALLLGELIDGARVQISERIRRQTTRALVQQMDVADRVGAMTAQMLSLFAETHLAATLAAHLVNLGIQHVLVAVYEAEDDDPLAWSQVIITDGIKSGFQQRLRTRAFPQPGLYPAEQAVQLAILPLIIEEQAVGFMAFDAANLEPCAAIMRNLAAALHTSRLYREASEGRRLAEEANRLKSRFLSLVSHELRTPLNLIAGLGDMLLRGDTLSSPGEQRADLQRIVSSAQHLDLLIGDVLDLASNDIGQLRLHREPLDLGVALQMVVATGTQLAHEQGLAWRAELPATGPLVYGDRTRLRQVVLNLVSNAVKFTSQGEIALRVTITGEQVAISVRDTGLGIAPADQPYVFDEFRRGERSSALGYRGLGLGLAVCKQLVALHDGHIELVSSGVAGEGSTFTVYLPLLLPSPAHSQLPVAAGQAVLLLADDLAVAQRLADSLFAQGIEVRLQPGDLASETLLACLTAKPVALLLDQACAVRRGGELGQLINQQPGMAQVPLLVFAFDKQTGSGAVLEWQQASKPLSTGQLEQLLAATGTGSANTQRSVLIVDDDAGMRDLHARIVASQGPHYRIRTAADGEAALAMIRAEAPDLVLLDLLMPRLDGFGVLEALRSDAATRNIPVVVLTAQRLSEEELQRLSAGVSAVLTKGMFSSEETLAHLVSAIERQRKQGSVTQRLVYRALGFLHSQYSEPITREQLAAYVGVNENYLTDCFHREMGVTPMNYLARYRIQQAQHLLTTSDLPITEVAIAVGFSDSAYFSRVFQRLAGSSPSAYRRSRRVF
jgi:signal transduction histidine kinase/AraC-like DNA-binding protein/ABC-type sugar transport system substrate-binding protein